MLNKKKLFPFNVKDVHKDFTCPQENSGNSNKDIIWNFLMTVPRLVAGLLLREMENALIKTWYLLGYSKQQCWCTVGEGT